MNRRRRAHWTVGFSALLVGMLWLLERWLGDAWRATTLLDYGAQLPWLGTAVVELFAAAVGRGRVCGADRLMGA